MHHCNAVVFLQMLATCACTYARSVVSIISSIIISRYESNREYRKNLMFMKIFHPMVINKLFFSPMIWQPLHVVWEPCYSGTVVHNSIIAQSSQISVLCKARPELHLQNLSREGESWMWKIYFTSLVSHSVHCDILNCCVRPGDRN